MRGVRVPLPALGDRVEWSRMCGEGAAAGGISLPPKAGAPPPPDPLSVAMLVAGT